MTYLQTLREVVNKDGLTGLFFRGLGTRILTNGLQVSWAALAVFLASFLSLLNSVLNFLALTERKKECALSRPVCPTLFVDRGMRHLPD